MEVLECRGCSGISVRRRYWFSEWESVQQDPLTGPLVKDIPEEVSYWPAKQTRTRPDWGNRLADENLRQVMEEVYVAVDHGLVVLAAIGARTLLDRAISLMVVDQKNGFAGKLNAMVAKGYMEDGRKGQVLDHCGRGEALLRTALTSPMWNRSTVCLRPWKQAVVSLFDGAITERGDGYAGDSVLENGHSNFASSASCFDPSSLRISAWHCTISSNIPASEPCLRLKATHFCTVLRRTVTKRGFRWGLDARGS